MQQHIKKNEFAYVDEFHIAFVNPVLFTTHQLIKPYSVRKNIAKYTNSIISLQSNYI